MLNDCGKHGKCVDHLHSYQFSSLYVYPAAQEHTRRTHTDLRIPYINLFYANKEKDEVCLGEHNMKI